MAPGLAEMFSAAIKQLLKREGRGGQVVLAERLGIKKAHLSNLLAGRSGWPDSMKERVAHIYGYSVAELLLLGEQLLQTGVWFPHVRAVQQYAPRSMERLEAIIRLAAADKGIGLTNMLFSAKTIPHIFPSTTEDYTSGRIQDSEVYDNILGVCEKICPTRKNSY